MLNKEMIEECLKVFNRNYDYEDSKEKAILVGSDMNKIEIKFSGYPYYFDWQGNSLEENYNFVSNELERLFKARLNSLDNSTVDAPNHYNLPSGKQLIDLLQSDLLTRSEFVGFCKGNVFKYVARYQAKNHREDLEKAKQYLNFLEGLEK